MAEHKLLGIILAVGLCLVAGLFFLIDTEDSTTQKKIGATVSVAPAPEDEKAGVNAKPAMGTALPSDSPLAGKVLVSQRPVQVLSAPNPSASALYGFPAGRPFRAVAKQSGYIRIQDLNSGASGWIEEAALAPAPAQIRATKPAPSGTPSAAKPSRSRASTSTAKPPKRTTYSAPRAKPKPKPQPRKRNSGGLFRGNGPLKGLFGGR